MLCLSPAAPVRPLLYIWLAITVVGIVLSVYSLLSLSVTIKYEFEEIVTLEYDHPAGIAWLLELRSVLRWIAGYFILNAAVLSAVLLRGRQAPQRNVIDQPASRTASRACRRGAVGK